MFLRVVFGQFIRETRRALRCSLDLHFKILSINMVNNSNARRYIKDFLETKPQTSRDLLYKIKKKVRRPPEFSEIRGICVTDPEIQYLDEPGRTKSRNGRWGLRSEIINLWEDNYINKTEKEYLSLRAFSDNLIPARRSEFEFFRSLRDIINKEE